MAMEIRPATDQKAFIDAAIQAGRIGSAEDAAQEAMSLWEERERRRMEILAAVDAAEASVARGDGIEITQESMRALAEDVKQRGRARLAAERQDVLR
jgi:Arc/MetJ-type ribon-helix-helix transcriptional regulator